MRQGRAKYSVDTQWQTWAISAPLPSLPPRLASKFEQLVAASLAKSTWKTLSSVERVVARTARDFELDLR